MKIYIKKTPDLKIPSQAYFKDACYDLLAIREPSIVGQYIEIFGGEKVYSSIQFLEYSTDIFLAPEPEKDKQEFHVEIFPRSSISVKNLLLCNGVGIADNGYRGEYICRFKYIAQPEDYILVPEAGINKFYIKINQDKIYHQNEKIAQIKAAPNFPISWIVVNDLPKSERGSGGFGSSDKK